MKELKERITENGLDYVLIGDYYYPDLAEVLIDIRFDLGYNFSVS